MEKEAKKHKIIQVEEGSIAEELELEPGDSLLTINGQEIGDVFDYRFLMGDMSLTVEVEKADGEIWELEIEKDYDEDLGIVFDNALMDEYRTCHNHCVFCFIDQMPPGMRPTLYFKDDDSRLSFLQGNYVTLTNLSDADIDRICRMHMEPINISFQAMDLDLRCQMLHNRFAGEALKKAQRFYEAGIAMNGQIVLCKGLNDGEQLEYSLQELSKMAPVLESVSIVPVGLTKFREGLYPLEPFTREDALSLIETVGRWQRVMYEKHQLHFVHASDEWYVLAGLPLPDEDSYDGYLQLENGVGMLRLLIEEFGFALLEEKQKRKKAGKKRRLTIATGELAAPFLRNLMKDFREVFPEVSVEVVPIVNHFFGESITVSGLVTGADLMEQLSGRDIGDALLLPANMLREQEDVFLDDYHISDVEKALGTQVVVVQEGGEDLLFALLHPFQRVEKKRRQTYEQTSSGDRGQA